MRMDRNQARGFARACLAGLALLVASAAPGQSQMPSPPDFLVTARSTYDFAETVRRIKGAIEEQNLMVIQEIDPQQMLRMVGVKTAGMRQILFFHPRYMKRILEGNLNAALEPPLKIAVMETADGRVMVRHFDLEKEFGRYPGLEKLGRELAGVVDAIVASVTG
ncbi:MAG: DUF302 domain-containing protein [Gemmatimonadota bacterium]